MWLDRLAGGQASTSGPSTPQPGSRPYSPLPRRTSSTLSPYVTSQRQGHSPRSSSLSLVSNESSASLLSSSRRPNGSGLRQSSTITDVADSLETLEKLLISHGGSDEDDAEKRTSSIVDADIEFDVEFGGLSLKELVSSQASEDAPVGTRRPQTIQECWSLLSGGARIIWLTQTRWKGQI